MEKIQSERFEYLISKYADSSFMYTEYPHKSFWSKEFGEEGIKEAFINVYAGKQHSSSLLYVHIPFCSKQCYYCTCHTIITKEYPRITNYLLTLFREMDLYREFFEKNTIIPNIKEIHLGGGSPTILHEKEFDMLIEKIGSIADIRNLNEFSLEIDPREVDKEKMEYYSSKGINRISFGVQDFDIGVQRAINRVQPISLIEELLTPDIRKYFPKGVNFDIICGLPNQTSDTIKETFRRIVKLSPERICFNYLHYVPHAAKHQKLMVDGRDGRPTRLPDLYEKKMLFWEALTVLGENGYLRMGYDHFAKANDDLYEATQKKTMHWNALGVTPGRYSDVIGIGIHSYTTVDNYYSQNIYEIPEYEAQINQGKFPIYRGYVLNDDDILRRDVIKTLRNFFSLDLSSIEEKYHIRFKDYFKQEYIQLAEYDKDGMLELRDDRVTITEIGKLFANLICKTFDAFVIR